MVVSVGDAEVDSSRWPSRAAALLRLLAVAPSHRRRREAIVDIFWPEAYPEAGSSNLRSTLQLLRQCLGGGDPPPVLSTQGWISLNPDLEWVVDVDQFEQTTEVLSREMTLEDLEQAAKLYRGEPLPDDRYEDWAVPLRENLRRRWREICLSAASFHRSRGALESAVDWLRRQLESDPLDEQTLRLLLETLAEQGHRTDALRAFQRFKEQLSQDLELEPDAETLALVERLKGAPQFAPEVGLAPEDPLTAAHAPLAPGLSHQGIYIGREQELDQLKDWLTATDGPKLVLLEAEAGMGKTRTLAELAGRAAGLAEAPIVLFGACYEPEGRLPYGPIRDVLLEYVNAQPDALLQSQLSGIAAELGRIVPEVRQRLSLPGVMDSTQTAGDTEAHRLRLFWAVAEAFSRIASQRPLLILLDDLQWADDSTIQLLHFLQRQLESQGSRTRAAIVAAYRFEEVRPDSPLAILSGVGRHERDYIGILRLGPLRDPRELVEAGLGGRASDELVRIIQELSSGNPLFVQQMTALLLEEGRVQEGTTGWSLCPGGTVEVPRAVRETITRRFRDLTPPTRELLTLAAVLGNELIYSALESMWEDGERELLSSIDSALEAGILDETARGYRFRHPLFQRALYDTASEARRHVLHRRAGTGLESVLGASASEHAAALAMHFVEAGADWTDRAIKYLCLAGDAARDAFAWTEALSFYQRALALLSEAPAPARDRHAELHERAGEVLMGAGRYDEARTHFTAALDAFRPSTPGRVTELAGSATGPHPGLRVAELRRKESIAWEKQGRLDLALRGLQSAADAYRGAGEDAVETLAAIQLSRAEVCIRAGKGHEAHTLAETAAASLDSSPSWQLGLAYHILGAAALQEGKLEQALAYHERSLEIRQAAGDDSGAAQSWNQLAQIAALRGELGRASEAYERAIAIYQRTGDPDGMASSWSTLGVAAMYRGGYEEAEAHLGKSLAIREQIGDPSRIADCWSQLGLVAARRGDLSEAERRLDRALSLQEKPDSRSQAGIWGTLGLVCFAKGEYDKAQEWYRKSLNLQEQMGDHYGLGLGLIGLALVYQCRGELAAAEELYHRSLELQRELGGHPWIGYALYGLGSVAYERGELHAALGYCRQSRRLAHRLGLHDLEALAALAQARVFLKAGRSRAPERLIARAMKLASDNNAAKTSIEAGLAMAEYRLLRSDSAGARDAADEALSAARACGLVRDEGLGLRLLGRVALTQGDVGTAVAQLSAAQAIFDAIGARIDWARSHMLLARALSAGDQSSSSEANPLDLLAFAGEVFREAGAVRDLAECDALRLQVTARSRCEMLPAPAAE